MSHRLTGRLVWAAIAALVGLAGGVGFAPTLRADSAPSPAVPATFELDRLRAHVEYLASDELRGRDTGGEGIVLAEQYIAKQFRELGLKPLPGRNEFFVEFPLYREGFDTAGTSVTVGKGSAATAGELGATYRPFPFTDEGEAAAEVVFAGYGISAPDLEWDDYADLDVAGKIVLVLRHTPGEDDEEGLFSGNASTLYGSFTSKAQNAQEHGAIGMLLVTDPLNHEDRDDFRVGRRVSLDKPEKDDADEGSQDNDDEEEVEEQEDEPFLAVHISRGLASSLVRVHGKTLSELQEAVDGGTQPAAWSDHTGYAAMSVAMSDDVQTVQARNVVGYLEGSDPKLKHEWVVVGGHHDHVGAFDGEGDTIFNGADDNASGTTGVMELARAFATSNERPRRSLVFATFSAEERGLYGSQALVRDKVLDPERVVFMFNLDMIGRNPDEPLQVYGDGFTRGLDKIVSRANKGVGLELTYAGDDYAGNSDHDAFYKEDIPFMFFFTGLHEDYHQIGDHAEKLDYNQMQQILTVARATLDQVANLKGRLAFIHHVGWLGVKIEVEDVKGVSVARVTHVDEDSRGKEAGVRVGDVIAAVQKQPIDDPDRIGARFRDIDPGTQVAIDLARKGKSKSIEVERARVGYMGIVPMPLSEEQQAEHGLGEGIGISLRQVVPNGPSGQAGLLAGDIVIQINGNSVGTSNLRNHLTRIGAGEKATVTVLRDGKRKRIKVTLGERPQRRG